VSARSTKSKPERERRRIAPATRLAELRIAKNLRQDEFAEQVGLSLRTLQRLEAGEIENPPLRYLVNCAIRLDVALDEVIEDSWREWLALDARAPDPR
jgi:transcriptional regulator with XRE-family HTH domain